MLIINKDQNENINKNKQGNGKVNTRHDMVNSPVKKNFESLESDKYKILRREWERKKKIRQNRIVKGVNEISSDAISGILTKSQVKKVLYKGIPQVLYCYNKCLVNYPAINGKASSELQLMPNI